MSEAERKEWWIVRVHGIEQGWHHGKHPRTLEDPKPFTGYISSIDWGWQASPTMESAYRFTVRPNIEGSAEYIGPWWYKIDRCEIIRIEQIITTIEHVETAPTSGSSRAPAQETDHSGAGDL